MKKVIALLIVLPFLLSAGAVIKSPKEGEGIEFWTKATSGSFTKKAEITDDGILRVDEITNVAGDAPPVGGVPVGTILPFAGATPPTGYLLCDGTLKDKGTNPEYSKLYDVIGTTYCVGCTGDQFRVPDFTTDNKFPRAAGGLVALGTEQADATAVNGLESAHDHPPTAASVGCTANQSSHTHNIPNHSHSFSNITSGSLNPGNGYGSWSHSGTASTNTVSLTGGGGGATTSTDPSISCSASGSVNLDTIVSLITGDIETRPYSIAVNFIIKY